MNILKRAVLCYKNLNIFKKIMGIFVCLFVIPMCILTLSFYMGINKDVELEMRNYYELITNQHVSGINSKIDTFNRMAISIITDKNVQESLSRDYKSIYIDIDNTKAISAIMAVYFSLSNSVELNRVEIFPIKEDFPSDGQYLIHISELEEEILDLYRPFNKAEDLAVRWLSQESSDSKLYILKPIMDMYNSSRHLELLGFLKVELDKLRFFEMNHSNNMADYGMFIINELQEPVYQYFSNEHIEKRYGGIYDHSAFLNQQKKDNFISVQKDLKIKGWKLIYVFPKNIIDYKVRDTVVMLVTLTMAIIAILSIVTVIFSKRFSNRFSQLLKKMKSVKEGNLDIEMDIKGNDEVAVAERNFYEMIVKLKKLILENYVQKIAKNEAEFRALQMQINPHFLYNALETINAIASVYDCEEIGMISQKMGQIMRYSLKLGSNEFVTIEDELEHVHNYITIQNYRFDNKIGFECEIEKGMENCYILKFIFQPIVENAVLHGLEGANREFAVKITVGMCDEDILVVIKDNGIGIKPERIDYINRILMGFEADIIENRQSIGISNVNSRIKLSYGDKYGLRLKSEYGVGTRAEIRIPLKDEFESREVNIDGAAGCG